MRGEIGGYNYAMPSKEAVQKLILDRYREKVGDSRPCVICGTNNWVVGDGFVVPVVQNDPHVQPFGD